MESLPPTEHDGTKGELHSFKDAADTLMTGPSVNCPQVTASCTPGSTSCTMPTITPNAATTTGDMGCVCVEALFPTQDATSGLKDFHAKVASGTNNFVALFTAHGPTEFERGLHSVGLHCSSDDYRELFRALDHNADGKVSKMELGSLMYPDEYAQRMFNEEQRKKANCTQNVVIQVYQK